MKRNHYLLNSILIFSDFCCCCILSIEGILISHPHILTMSNERVTQLLNDYISTEEMSEWTSRFNTAVRSGKCPPSLQFQYALALTRSRYKADHMRAVNLLEDLCVSGEPEVFRDYLYYLTINNIKLQVWNIE